MRLVAEFRERARALLFWNREEDAMEEELRFHVEMETQKHVDAGLTAWDAKRHALRRFGGLAWHMDEIRQERGIGMFEHLGKDLRQGVRMLRKQPGFSAIVALTLALGIGATSAIFSLIYGALLTPPPYADPDRLVLITPQRTDGDTLLRAPDWTANHWLEWQTEAKSFDALAAYRWTFSFMISNEGSEAIEGMGVSRDYLRVMGLQPVLGRAFEDADTEPSSPPVVLIGYDLWQRRFAGSPDVLGKTLPLARQQVAPTIVGVMPPAIRFLPSPAMASEPNYDVHSRVDYWVPVRRNPQQQTAAVWNVVARLKGTTTIEEAEAEMQVLTRRQAEQFEPFQAVTPRLRSVPAEANRAGELILLPLLGAAVLVLLIACGNAAALLLVRGLQRRQEYGVRSAVGAQRAALFRQVAVESLVLAIAGSVIGMFLALGVVRLFVVIGGNAIPRLDAVTVGWPVFVCGLALAVGSAMLAALFPALRASRLDPINALRETGTRATAGRSDRRLLGAVVLAQTTLTVALLVGAGLLIRTVYNLSNIASGYDTSRILTMSVTAVQGDMRAYHERALEQVSTLSGVRGAAFVWGVPLTGNNWPGQVAIEGLPETERSGGGLMIPLRSVTPGYFDLLRMPLLEGRDFRPQEEEGVAIVNETFAKRYFANGSAIGRQIWTRGRQAPGQRIIGIIADSRTEDLTKPAGPEIYQLFWQAGAFSKHLIVRTEAEPVSMAASIRQALRAVDPTVAVENVKTFEELRGDSVASQRFAMQLLIGFAIVAVVLTAGGIYGVLSLAVASRRREIAIRSALGAERAALLRHVVGGGAWLIVGGVVGGLVLAVSLSRVLGALLFGIEPTDPLTILAAGAVFAVVAVVSCWVPARRALRVNPIEALRES